MSSRNKMHVLHSHCRGANFFDQHTFCVRLDADGYDVGCLGGGFDFLIVFGLLE